MWKRRAMNGLKGESFTETLRTLEKEEKEKKTENRTKGPEEGRQRVRKDERGKREKARKLESKAKYLAQIFSKLSY